MTTTRDRFWNSLANFKITIASVIGFVGLSCIIVGSMITSSPTISIFSWSDQDFVKILMYNIGTAFLYIGICLLLMTVIRFVWEIPLIEHRRQETKRNK
jgi:hypothetical protein